MSGCFDGAAPEAPARTPMRALILGVPNSPHIGDLALGLSERGVEVVVGGTPAPNLPPASLEREVRVEAAPPVAGLAYPAQLVRRVRWTRRLVRRVGPDVVHAHYLVEDPFYAVLARVRPLVATAWGSDVLVPKHVSLVRSRLVARRADFLTADSETLLDALANLGAKRDRLRLVNWGVDLDLFRPGREDARRRLGLPDVPIVLAPRALKPIYNPRTIVEAFDLLRAEFPDALLLLKHYGPLPPELEDVNRRDDVQLVGHVPTAQLADFFRAASVCVSIPSSDSSPRTVWEAMACGCPCVLSDLQWVHELIADGRDALVAPVDAGSVAAAIGRILRGDQLAAALSENGRSLVERHHRRSTEVDRLLDIYRTVARA
jgi:glycosyltransferase involved in cell wall biosynthesis